MAANRAVLFLVPFCLVFAGCVGGETSSVADPNVAGPATYSDDTGAVNGLVTSEEFEAIVGAQAGLIELPTATGITGEDGRFSISNVPPGKYRLAVQSLGYEAVAQSIEILAGQATEVKLTLPVLPIDAPYPELLIHSGIIKNGVGVIRTATCTNCGSKETFQFLPKNKLPADFMGMMIESTWRSADYLGIDVVDREINNKNGASYWRIRSQSPIHYLVERCGNYTEAPFYAKQGMPCTDEQLDGDRTQIENWYIGGYQQETHNLDAVCRVDIPDPRGGPNLVNGYKAGCYGLGFTPELKYTNYITIFHKELPDDVKAYTAIPDA